MVSIIDQNSVKVNPNLLKREENDFKIEWYSGTGSGGQHRNKHQNSARITHLPTGIVKTAQTRKRESSQREAMAALLEELDNQVSSERGETLSKARKEMTGTGQRGDKIRTYQFQNDRVIDHNTGNKSTCVSVMKGNFSKLWR